MMVIAKFETLKNFSILNKALLFLIKLNKTALQSVPKLIYNSYPLLCFDNNTAKNTN